MTETTVRRPAPFVLANDDAPAYWKDGALWLILAAADRTQGVFTMLEQLMPGGGGPPSHVHERVYEVFYLLGGEITFQVGNETIRAGAGATVWIPPGTPHSFRITSETARALNIYVPGGFDDNISSLETPATARTLPPPEAMKPPTPEQEQTFDARLRDLHMQTWLPQPRLPSDDGHT